MTRYWWLLVSCLMNSDIDPATVPFDNGPPVSRLSFTSNTMDSSCELSHAVSAKPPSTGTGKIKLVIVLPQTYHTLLLSYIYEWMFTDFRGLLLKNMHRQTPISNQMRRHECNYVLIRTNYWFNHLKPSSHNSRLKIICQANSMC